MRLAFSKVVSNVSGVGAYMALRICAAGLIGAALAMMAGGHEARAQSAGCLAAVQQLPIGFNGSATAGQSKASAPITFSDGDTLNFTVTINNFDPSPPAPSGNWGLLGSTPPQIRNQSGTFAVTYQVKGQQTLQEVIAGQPPAPNGGTVTVSVTCTSVSSKNPTTNSQKVAVVQSQGSRIVGQASGSVIIQAVNSAVQSAIQSELQVIRDQIQSSGPGSLPPGGDTTSGAGTGAPNLLGAGSRQMGLGAGSEQMGLGAGSEQMGLGVPPINVRSTQREWTSWATVLGSGWDQDDRNGSAKGNQVNAIFGVHRLLMPGVVVGLVGGYENFHYDFDSISGRLRGDGWTAGAYGAWAFTRNLRLDLMGAWTGLSYDALAGTAAGSFNADRWLVSTGVTGTYLTNGFIVEPSSRLYALWERQNGWTDSLGTDQAGQSFSTGRVSNGARVIYPWQIGAGTMLSPYVGIYGDYRFSSDETVPVSVPFVGLSNGWSARVTTGAAMTFNGGTRLSLDGEFGGIGSDQSFWVVGARGSIPF